MKNLKMKSWVLFFLLASQVTLAARIEDIQILDVVSGPENHEIKMTFQHSPPGSFFLVDINKEDPEGFTKLGHILKKVSLKEGYRLDLEIPSFSFSPSGSYYKSDYIRFFGTGSRTPDSLKKAPKSGKNK